MQGAATIYKYNQTYIVYTSLF